MTEDQKEQIDRYIQIYINGVQSVSNDAGWEGSGTMGKIIDFAGDLPTPTGNDQSNLSMINAIRLLKEQHKKWPIISAAVKTLLISSKRDQMIALLAKHLYVGQCPWTNKVWTNTQRAEEVGQSLKVYENNLGRGYRAFQNELDVAERYRQYFGLAS